MSDKRNLREIIDLDFRKRVICEDTLIESTKRHCDMYLASNGRWYMELADQEHGTLEEAVSYGPFLDQEACVDYLNNFANPGGWGEDDSGTRPPPTLSPNGQKVQSSHGAIRGSITWGGRSW